MKGKQKKTVQDDAISEVEWRAFGRSTSRERGEELGKLPERIEKLGLERFERLKRSDGGHLGSLDSPFSPSSSI